MSPWQSLDVELDAWRAAGRQPTLWCRDDDARRDSPALHRLLDVAQAAEVPVALAAVPATLEQSLVDAVTPAGVATIVQHGWAHRNHAVPPMRSRELGGARPVGEVRVELERGLAVLRVAFGRRFAPILVPPWNRVDDGVVAILPEVGYRGLSRHGPRAAVMAAPGVVQCNTHVDLIAWRHDRKFVGVAGAIDGLAAHLRARREGLVDASEPTGVLVHHLDMNEAGWQFLADVMVRARQRGAIWLDVRTVFRTPDVAGVTSGR